MIVNETTPFIQKEDKAPVTEVGDLNGRAIKRTQFKIALAVGFFLTAGLNVGLRYIRNDTWDVPVVLTGIEWVPISIFLLKCCPQRETSTPVVSV